MKNLFATRQAQFYALEQQHQKTFNVWATLRLVFFGVSAMGLYFFYQEASQSYFWLMFIFCIIIFVLIISKHQNIRILRDKNRFLATINADEINQLEGRFTAKETGEGFDETQHFYTKDLDIFGNYSIFKLLNRTHTHLGASVLADWLKKPSEISAILARQSAVEGLRSAIDFRQDLEAVALLESAIVEPTDDLLRWVQEPDNQKLNKAFFKVVKYLPLLTCGLIVAWVLDYLPFAWASLLLLVHGIVLVQFFKDISLALEKTRKAIKPLNAFTQLAKLIDNQVFNDTLLKKHQANLTGASLAIGQLGSILTNISYRQNPYFYIFVALPSLWDLVYFSKLENWKKQYRQQLPLWLETIAEVEAINSLAGFAFANPNFVKPIVNNDSITLKIRALGHPLIPEEKRICNDVNFGELGHTMILTGSNMSGKSTFQRTLSINIILALAGGVVCAKAFECGLVQVFTSMRSQDSLEESTSSFYAELKRLKQLIDLVGVKLPYPVFYCLDEILKGTNSKDRHNGAKALVLQLQQQKAFGIVSTHDVELGDELENEAFIQNYSFYSDVINGQLSFDYQLRKGVCHSFNASQLMQQIGIKM